MTVVLLVQDTAAFFEHFENLCFDSSVGIMLRKMDKKKEKYSLNTSSIDSLTHYPVMSYLQYVLHYPGS